MNIGEADLPHRLLVRFDEIFALFYGKSRPSRKRTTNCATAYLNLVDTFSVTFASEANRNARSRPITARFCRTSDSPDDRPNATDCGCGPKPVAGSKFSTKKSARGSQMGTRTSGRTASKLFAARNKSSFCFRFMTLRALKIKKVLGFEFRVGQPKTRNSKLVNVEHVGIEPTSGQHRFPLVQIGFSAPKPF